MINQATVDKLIEMRLSVMANAFHAQQKDVAFAGLSFEERFGLLVDSEWASRKNNRLQRLIRAADFNFPGARRYRIPPGQKTRQAAHHQALYLPIHP